MSDDSGGEDAECVYRRRHGSNDADWPPLWICCFFLPPDDHSRSHVHAGDYSKSTVKGTLAKTSLAWYNRRLCEEGSLQLGMKHQSALQVSREGAPQASYL